MDGMPTDKISDIEDYFPVITADKNSDDSSLAIRIYLFSSEDLQIEWGDLNGLPFSAGKSFENNVQNYAIENNLMPENDNILELPDDFYEYQDQQYQVFFGTTTAYWLRVYDDFVPYGDSQYIMSKIMPILPGWNDRIGCYRRGNMYSVERLCRRTLFRKTMATLSGWGTSYAYFIPGSTLGYLNNQVSSLWIF